MNKLNVVFMVVVGVLLALVVSTLTGCTSSVAVDDNQVLDIGCGGADNAWTFNMFQDSSYPSGYGACVQTKTEPETCGPMVVQTVGSTGVNSTKPTGWLTIQYNGATFSYQMSTYSLQISGLGKDPISVDCPNAK
jgi:hypothetical protein